PTVVWSSRTETTTSSMRRFAPPLTMFVERVVVRSGTGLGASALSNDSVIGVASMGCPTTWEKWFVKRSVLFVEIKVNWITAPQGTLLSTRYVKAAALVPRPPGASAAYELTA